MTDNGFRRRDFFKVLAAGSAATAVAACSDPPEKLIPYLVPPSNIEFTPGNPVEYATTCAECPAACGMVIKTREARAIKAEGNPDHPVNRGALCIRGQSSLQTLYNPTRIRTAMRREGEAWNAVAWTDAEAAFLAAIQAVTSKQRIALITDSAMGSRGEFLDKWLAALGASPKVVLDALGQNAIKVASEMVFSRGEIPQYRIDQAQLLVNFGSDFLETWLSPVRQNREFAAMHAVDDHAASKGKFVHIAPHVSLTGANADEWLSIAPGSEADVALALAREVFEARRRQLPGNEAGELERLLEPYGIERAAARSGIDAERLKALAKAIAGAESSLVLAGGTPAATSNAVGLQVAVNLLNYVAGNVGKTVLFGASQRIDPSSPHADVLALVNRMRNGDIDLLIVDGANPLYALPPTAGVAEGLGKVKTIVSLSSAWDETTSAAHLVLPGLTFLERWGDAFPQTGVYGLMQPVMAPVFPVKAAEDTLLSVATTLSLAGLKDTPTYQDYLKAAWAKVQSQTGQRGDFAAFWRNALQNGGVFQQVTFSGSVRLNLRGLQVPTAAVAFAGEGLVLLPAASLRHRDGRGANKPWLQEIPDPISQVVWGSWADINPETAKRLGIRHGERIKVSSPYGELETAAYLHYGVHPDVIAIPMGQGHSRSGRNADDVGVNVMTLLPAQTDAVGGDLAYLSTRVGVKGTGKSSQMVQTDGSPRQMDRGIIQSMTLAQVAKGEPPAEGHGGGHGEASAKRRFFYPEREQTPGYYDPYRWGMTVDSDRCTGCSACVAACYAENNVPVVGRERVALGREMSWIRVERFLEGSGDSYRTLVQPMFCQHCENAGCEPVCPVYATYHNPEGLNAQIYNRCVGTRYCSNNCAYKVRRFNWFEYLYDAPLHLQLNPDVTVRTKGVMEKCTMCVQRITRAKDKARTEGRIVRDGEITPACVQTCPTSALTFGNLHDPGSEVSKKAQRETGAHRVRQYEVLADLQNRPAVTYLRKVTLENGHKEA